MFEEKDLSVFSTTATGLLGAIPPDQLLMNSILTANTVGTPWQLRAQEKEATYALGTPYSASSGKPIPDDWRGAQLTGWDRSLLDINSNRPRWVYRMRSDWGNDIVLLHLDANEVSGGEADKIAGTYMEALNQRRIG